MSIERVVIIPNKLTLYKRREPIQHFFLHGDGFAIRNIRFYIHIEPYEPPKARLHIKIWLPLIHIVRDSTKWEIGNRLVIYCSHKKTNGCKNAKRVDFAK